MPIRCATCSKSFIDNNALQMHQAAKCHKRTTVDQARSTINPKGNAKPAATSSNARPTAADLIRSADSLKFYCSPCDRVFKSREAIDAHNKAKHRIVTPASKLRVPGLATDGHNTSARVDPGRRIVQDNHSYNSNGCQTSNPALAPPKSFHDSGTFMDSGNPVRDHQILPVRVDKSIQCDLSLCSLTLEEHRRYGSTSTPFLWKGHEQQAVLLSNPADLYPLILERFDTDLNAMLYQVPPMYTYLEASQPPALFQDSSSYGVPTVTNSVFPRQPSATDYQIQTLSTSQLQSELFNGRQSEQPKPVKFLGKEWATIPPSEQPLILQKLNELCHPISDLEKHHYPLKQARYAELMEERKCNVCKSM